MIIGTKKGQLKRRVVLFESSQSKMYVTAFQSGLLAKIDGKKNKAQEDSDHSAI
jgi:hypothetical protein